MKIFGISDSRLLFFVYAVIIAGAAFTGNYLAAAAAAAAGGATLLVLFVRRKRLQKLSEALDIILQGKSAVNFGDYCEGELHILENQLEKVVLRLRDQSEKLKGEKIYLMDSLADISHQLRTPLTGINLLISFLRTPRLKDEKRYELVKDLQTLTDRIEWLINALLKISKIDAGRITFRRDKVDVQQMIQKSRQPLEIAMDLKSQTLVYQAKGGEYFTGDMGWMCEAVGNIIKNCSEHTPEGGCITVDAEQTAVYTQISISDTGPGFSRQDLPNIFNRFYKGENSSAQSVGIGLAMARAIITGQNGTIKAENTGSGAKFTIKMYHSVL